MQGLLKYNFYIYKTMSNLLLKKKIIIFIFLTDNSRKFHYHQNMNFSHLYQLKTLEKVIKNINLKEFS